MCCTRWSADTEFVIESSAYPCKITVSPSPSSTSYLSGTIGVSSRVNIDTDGDGKPDVNIDTDKDGKPDINIDPDGDNIPIHIWFIVFICIDINIWLSIIVFINIHIWFSIFICINIDIWLSIIVFINIHIWFHITQM